MGSAQSGHPSRDFGRKTAAVFALDGPHPSQFDYDCVYAPEVGAEVGTGEGTGVVGRAVGADEGGKVYGTSPHSNRQLSSAKLPTPVSNSYSSQ